MSDFIRAFCEDRDGALWIGTDGGLSRFQHGTFQNFKIEDGLVYSSVRALLLGSWRKLVGCYRWRFEQDAGGRIYQ